MVVLEEEEAAPSAGGPRGRAVRRSRRRPRPAPHARAGHFSSLYHSTTTTTPAARPCCTGASRRAPRPHPWSVALALVHAQHRLPQPLAPPALHEAPPRGGSRETRARHRPLLRHRHCARDGIAVRHQHLVHRHTSNAYTRRSSSALAVNGRGHSMASNHHHSSTSCVVWAFEGLVWPCLPFIHLSCTGSSGSTTSLQLLY
jgi:hypothetical protein